MITSKITITSYGLFSLKQHGGRSLTDIIIKTKFGVVILDESHYIKNVKSVRTKEISRAAKCIPHVFMLSGTPSLARPEEVILLLFRYFRFYFVLTPRSKFLISLDRICLFNFMMLFFTKEYFVLFNIGGPMAIYLMSFLKKFSNPLTI